jgi:TPR repeat protein
MHSNFTTSFFGGRRWACLLALGFLLHPIAAAADPPESVALARAYEHGEGVAKDTVRAAALYCEAARTGDVEAAYALGWMYANGRGMLKDDRIATGLFRYASERGHD